MAARQYREMDVTTCGTHTIQDAVEIVSDIPAVLQDIVPGMWHSNLAAETCTKSGPCGVADGRFQAERGDQGLYLVIMGVSQHTRQYIVGSRDTLATDTGRMICIQPRWLHVGGIFAVGKLCFESFRILGKAAGQVGSFWKELVFCRANFEGYLIDPGRGCHRSLLPVKENAEVN